MWLFDWIALLYFCIQHAYDTLFSYAFLLQLTCKNENVRWMSFMLNGQKDESIGINCWIFLVLFESIIEHICLCWIHFLIERKFNYLLKQEKTTKINRNVGYKKMINWMTMDVKFQWEMHIMIWPKLVVFTRFLLVFQKIRLC